MTIQPPTGVKARFAPGWGYLTVPGKNGHAIEVEWSIDSEPWHEGAKFGAEFLVPMYADPRKTDWRARYKRGDSVSEWTTGKVGSPDYFQEDGHNNPNPDPDPTPKPPATPTGLTVTSTDATRGEATVSWTKSSDAEHWMVRLVGDANWRRADQPEFTFSGLQSGTTYDYEVKAVKGTGESSAARGQITITVAPPKPDPDPNPDQTVATPRNVRAHCIAPTSTKLEWDRDPVVHEYEVWLDAHRDAAQRTQDTLVSVKGLSPSTSYTAYVVAHTANGHQSGPGSVVFKTGSPEPAPDPDPDVDVGADWPAPELMVWPIENGKVRATWTDPDDGTKPKTAMGYVFWHVSVDQKTWFFTKDREFEFEIATGAEVMFSVYGVWDNTLTAIATKGAAL